ncbi:MAG: MFS transporter, partial [Terracidiphilus sp.]
MSSASGDPQVSLATTAPADRMTYQRWVICALLFFATVIAYVDRAVIANLKNTLEGVIPGLNDYKYGIITVAFQLAYGIAMLVAGGLTDKLGTRKAFAIAITLWSIAAMLPGAAFSVASFAVAMFLLGLGEAANFPACIKTVAEWFPKRERAFATGLFNSGANVGNMVAPVVVAVFVALFSQWSVFGPARAWRGSFFVAGAVGFVWLVFWLIVYRRPEDQP